MLDLSVLPETSNRDLSYLNRPKRLSRQEFTSLVVSDQEMSLREKIYAFEEYICTLPESYNEFEYPYKPIHTIVPGSGVYIRTLAIPPDQIIIGHRHAIEHQVMLAKGSCVCITERGIEHMVAPMQFISPAGEKRIVITSDEEAVWITVHETNETDVDKIEQDILIHEPDRRKFQMEQRDKNRLAIQNEKQERIS